MASNRDGNNINDPNIDSKVYKWNGVTFAEFQSIPTIGAWDWEAFEIGGEHYLAVANNYDGQSSTGYNIDSKVYKWNGAALTSVPTGGSTRVRIGANSMKIVEK